MRAVAPKCEICSLQMSLMPDAFPFFRSFRALAKSSMVSSWSRIDVSFGIGMFVGICLFLFLVLPFSVSCIATWFCRDIRMWAGFGVVIAQDVHCSPSFPTAVFHVGLYNEFLPG